MSNDLRSKISKKKSNSRRRRVKHFTFREPENCYHSVKNNKSFEVSGRKRAHEEQYNVGSKRNRLYHDEQLFVPMSKNASATRVREERLRTSVFNSVESISKNPGTETFSRGLDNYSCTKNKHDFQNYDQNPKKPRLSSDGISSKTGESISRNLDNQNFKHTITPTPMSYTCLKNLCDDQITPEETSSRLSEHARLQRFEALLQQQNGIRYDLMKMVVSVIDKVCQSPILTHSHTILGIMNKTRFWSTLGIFIAELDTKNECLKDPHVSILLKHLCKIFSVSLERLPNLHSHIPFHQLQSAVNFFKGNGNVPTDHDVDNLLSDMIAKCERVKKGIREKGQSQVEPPDDFRTLSVFPTAEDIFRRGKPFLRENIIKRPFSSVDHYLDVHFRLLKEDSLASLRNGIWDLRKSYKQQQYGQTAVDSVSKSRTARAKNDVIVYNEVAIKEQVLTNRRNVTKGIAYNVTFNANHPSIKQINWARSKRLLFGSLVCLVSNDFEKVHFATVENRSADMLEQGYIQLCFEGNKCPGYDDMQEEYRMVESSSAYFVAYRHILERLQQMKDETMPFKEYIVFCEHEIAKPSYFKADKQETINLESVAVKQLQLVDEDQNSGEVLKNVSPYDLSTWPDWDAIGLNESQYRAFQSALRREFVVIQGPPGTGKTYLGLKIAHTLLDNNHLWKDADDVRSCPILMLAYTNHALDSFLEGLNLNRKDIIRVGGRSSSNVLKECNINVVRRERQSINYQGRVRRTRGRRFHQVRREREECQASLNRYTDILAKSFKGILQAKEFRECMMVAEHMECLSDNNIMLDFLGITVNPGMGQNATEMADEEEGFEEFFGHELGGHFYVGDFSQLEEDEKREANDKILICLVEETSCPDGLLELINANITLPERTEALEIRTRGSELLQLNAPEKWSLYLLWLTRLREKLHNNIREKQSKYLDLNNEYEELRNLEDLGILRNSRVVGMTTTCASKNHKLLRQLKPRVVIIEEAAELFEAHIVSCLTESCQHLILIGDHQQLRPNPSVYNLSVKYSLDVSLLERMIEAGVPFNRLSVQHRMRPEISKLFRHIYDGLDDHASVTEYENVRGVSKNVFFVDHDVRESVHENVHSKVNQHEAEFLAELCLYLLRQGYKSSQITVLTTYKGQMFAIRDIIKSKKEEFEDNLPRVSNVDNFQGEENDVILLSLVRNNEEENIGFLKTDNRVCVALSRAKKGLYICGNRTMLTKQSPLWKEILADLEKNGFVGKSLPLECSKHKTQNLVSSAADFKELVPNGGCLKKCQERLQCGHACPQMCHPNSHENFKCEKPCPRNASGCNVSGHKCIKLCYEKCDYLCQYPVPKVLNCGHTLTLACSVDAETAKCKERCEKKIPCGHRCQAFCSAPCTKQCMELVKKLDLSCGHQNTMACFATQKDCTVPCGTLLECGHPCVGKCGECIQGRVHVKCAKKCDRNLICSHQCKSNCVKNCPPCKEKCPRKCYHNKCKHTCADICIPCKEPCSWICEHYQCTQLCSDMCDRPRCDRPCNRKLTCGKGEPHFCRSLCEERCVCVICDKNNGEDLRTIFFGNEDNEDARFIRLKDCEHIFEYTALDKMMDSNDESGEIKPKVCPLCRAPIIKSLRYGNVVKTIHNDIDQIKKKVLGNATELEEKKTLVRRLASELSTEVILALESMKSMSIERAWKKVAEYISRCKSSPVYYQDILLVESEMHLVKNWLHIKRSYEEAIKCQKQNRSCTSHIEFESEMQNVLSRILVIPAYTSERILNQLNRELQRMSLRRDVLVLKIKCASSKSNLDEADEEIVTRIQKILRNKEIIEENSLEKFKKEIFDIYSRNPQLARITEEEKIQIVRAIGLKQGHWFKCPNGHFYAIGECGGAMEKSKCPDCGAVIGGQHHRLTSDNELAPEMDEAKYPAWSDQANIQNYQIDD